MSKRKKNVGLTVPPEHCEGYIVHPEYLEGYSNGYNNGVTVGKAVAIGFLEDLHTRIGNYLEEIRREEQMDLAKKGVGYEK